MTPEEAQQLLSGDFGKTLLKAACDYCIPLYWSTPKKTRWTVDNNGTAFVLDCGKGPFLVTAAHVYEAYLKRRSQCSDICLQLKDLVFNMEEKVISFLGSEKLDIATFKISSKEIDLLGRRILQGNQTVWPPPSAKEKDGALFAGFPGLQRREQSENECSFGFYASLTPISSVSDRHLGCAFDRSKWIDTLGKGLPPCEYDLGGISGAPVLVVEESKAGVLSWRLGGVAYNASNNLGEILFAHHAKFIKEDGNLWVD